MSSHHNIYSACTETLHNNSSLYPGKRTKEEKEKCNISTGFMCCSRNEMNTQLSGLSKTYLGSGKHSFQKMGYSLSSVRWSADTSSTLKQKRKIQDESKNVKKKKIQKLQALSGKFIALWREQSAPSASVWFAAHSDRSSLAITHCKYFQSFTTLGSSAFRGFLSFFNFFFERAS